MKMPSIEEIEIEVGDTKHPDFRPRMKTKRWDNEINFSVGIISDIPGTHTEIDGIIEWDDGNGVKARFYKKHNDGFEFEIELAKKPTPNIITLSTTTKGLVFYYQPELTKAEVDGGAFRPENIVGSYAVYHESKAGDYSKLGSKNYMAGKAFHIYRPRIIDNAGKEVWGKLNIADTVLTIEIPQKFLDEAVYPIIVDPTFGHGSVGGTYYSIQNEIAGSKFPLTEAGTATSMSIWTYYDGRKLQAAIYDSSLDKVNSSVEFSGSSQDWASVNISASLSIADYWLLLNQYDQVFVKYDSGDADQGLLKSQTYDTWPNTVDTPTYNTRKYSIYCTYTASGAGRTTKNTRQSMNVHPGVMFQTLTGGHGH